MAEKKTASQVVPRTSKVTSNLAQAYDFEGIKAAMPDKIAAAEAGVQNYRDRFTNEAGVFRGNKGVLAERQKRVTNLRAQMEDPSKTLGGMEQQMYKGAKFAEGLLGEEGLGRLGDDAEVSEALGRFKNIADQGLSRQEVEAERAAAFQGIDRNTQTSQRALQAALARAGVKGASAGQQLLQGEVAGLTAKAGVERDLFLKSEQMKRQGLQDYSQRLGDIKTFDISQAAAEKDIALQTGLSFAQMKSARDIAKVQGQSSERAAQAQASANSCFYPDTLVKMVDGSYKRIVDIELGDEASTGMVTATTKHIVDGSRMCSVRGNIMTKDHILHNGKEFVLAETMADASIDIKGPIVVYDLIIEDNHMIELENNVHATDYVGIDYDAEAMREFMNEFAKEFSRREI